MSNRKAALALAAASVSTIVTVIGMSPAYAAVRQAQDYALPPQPLGDALRAVAERSGRNIIAPSALVDGVRVPALNGHFTAEEAVSQLLAGSGLTLTMVGPSIVVQAAPQRDHVPTVVSGPDDGILVTGSRIRGAPIASPKITVGAEQIRDAGLSSLGQVVRSIPQSFGGGQNPGIGLNVPAINGADVGGGSSINLRGLGSDATLTLINGHRIAYTGSRQSIDVSTIPLGVLDRIEIIPDGASALYGSDAVGGVADIVLKRDMEGLTTGARLAGSTDGGNFEQQYDVTGGSRWRGGGFIAAYEFDNATAITADDRNYAAARSPGLTLYPAMRNHNALVSMHQRVSEALSVSLDSLFNDRRTTTDYATNPQGDLAVGRQHQVTTTRAYAIVPTLAVDPGAGWEVALSGSYAENNSTYRISRFATGRETPLAAGCYCNKAHAIDLAADGPVLAVPAGAIKAAIGAGYRDVGLTNDRGDGNPLNFRRSQWDRYVYGELSFPVVAPAQKIAGFYRLNLSAAVRYEGYQATASVATPKFGLIYAPIPALDLKASWGRSFRAPTLLERYQPPLLELLPASAFGARGGPSAATALYVMGGNPSLRPERASTWSVTAALHPRTLPGLSAEISYFKVDYTNRIVNPIGFLSRALSDPTYAAWVTRSPSPDALAALLASGASFYNGTGAAYDPSSVVAVIDNSNVNAGHQRAHGIDLLGGYRASLGNGDTIAVNLDASYLVSRRQISSNQPDRPLAGTLFNPPHWRGRATASWQHRGLTLTAVANYTGKLEDTRYAPALTLPDQVQADLVARYRTGNAAIPLLRHLEFTLSIDDVFNATPPPIVVTTVSDTPYDSTNYSPLGRVVSLGVRASW